MTDSAFMVPLEMTAFLAAELKSGHDLGGMDPCSSTSDFHSLELTIRRAVSKHA